jgi:hypothetical protein
MFLGGEKWEEGADPKIKWEEGDDPKRKWDE